MEKRLVGEEGQRIKVVVDDLAVHSDADRDPIESDPDEFDENNVTEALILVEPLPNSMTPAGAIAGVGIAVRKAFGPPISPQPGHWWHDWGKYVIPMGLGVIVVTFGRFFF